LLVRGGLLVAPLLVPDDAQVTERARLSGLVAGLPVQGQGPPEQVAGLLVPALLQVDDG
jgi:hypothetical protein